MCSSRRRSRDRGRRPGAHVERLGGRRVPPHRRGRARREVVGRRSAERLVRRGRRRPVPGESKVGAEAYAVQLAEDARRFTLTRSELRAGIDRLLVYVTFLIVPTAALLFVSQLRARDDWREAMSGAVAGTVAMVPEGLVLLTASRSPWRWCVSLSGRCSCRSCRRSRVSPAWTCCASTRREPSRRASSRSTGWKHSTEMSRRRPRPLSPLSRPRTLAERHHDGDRRVYPDAPATGERRGRGVLVVPQVERRVVRRSRGMDPRCARRAAARRRRSRAPARPGARAARPGHRVLLVATPRRSPASICRPTSSPPALVVLADRPRPDAADTLRYFAEQDVTVKVISGDHPRDRGRGRGTARARRRRRAGRRARASGATRTELADVLESHSVFGRVSPQQKRAMVRALQARAGTPWR